MNTQEPRRTIYTCIAVAVTAFVVTLIVFLRPSLRTVAQVESDIRSDIETSLVKGMSTKADVERWIGERGFQVWGTIHDVNTDRPCGYAVSIAVESILGNGVVTVEFHFDAHDRLESYSVRSMEYFL